MEESKLHLLGYASALAGAGMHVGDGPTNIQKSPLYSAMVASGIPIEWDTMFVAPTSTVMQVDSAVRELCIQLAKKVSALIHQQIPFTVIGGDHTCAIGTWSGVYDALHKQGEIGLLWIDAHMDSHTPETTESGHLHGMPLAALLGHGYQSLTSVLHAAPKFKPENVCLLGVRSFERGEAELLQRLNVRIYFMEEIKCRGFQAIWQEAIQHVAKNTIGYGVSLDIDSIDPLEAPGVDVPEPDGIHAKDLYTGLAALVVDPKFVGAEIVEFDPLHDKNHITEQLIVACLEILAKGKRIHD